MATYYKKSPISKYFKSSTQKALQSSSYVQKSSERENNGGLFGGIGYLGEKVGLGFLSGLEGIWDFAAGGLADLFGADEWAEEQFANDWVNYNHADEWFDPGRGWQIAGDVAGGIGTSLPSLITAAGITVATGGTGAPVAAGLVAGVSAAGNATKEAYRETGNLTGKEYGFGVLSGVTEGAIEGVTGALGAGVAKIGKDVGKTLAKSLGKESLETVGKNAAKTGIKNIGTQLLKDFAGEAFEEGFSEFISPYYKKLTYDPNAKNATVKDIGYSALVGGLSGAIMSGGSISINTTANLFAGKKATEKGLAANLMKAGKVYADYETEGVTSIDAYASAADIYGKLTESLMKTNGIADVDELMTRADAGELTFNAKEKMLLGALQRENTIGQIYPLVEKSALGVLANPEATAQTLSNFGMKDANGNVVSYTAEQIAEGIDDDLRAKFFDGSATKQERAEFTKQLRAAIKTNPALATLSVADATGRIIMDSKKFETAAKNGAARMTPDTLAQYKERATTAQKEAFAHDLGYNTLGEFYSDSFEGVQARLEQYLYDNAEEIATRTKAISEIKNASPENIKKAPKVMKSTMADGVYALDEAFAALKKGGEFYLFNRNTGDIGKPLSVSELNKHLKEARAKGLEQVRKNDNARNALSGELYVEIDLDSEIQKELSAATPEERGKIVERELKIAAKAGVEYAFHDDTVAIMDNSDISKVGHSKFEAKARASVSMEELVKVARLVEPIKSVEHPKFKAFKYYKVRVKIGQDLYECVINVGLGKFDGKYHIYDVNQFDNIKRGGSPILSNPRKSVEQTVSRATTSINIIPQNSENSNTFAENISEDAANLSENENSAEKVGTETEDRAENVHKGSEDGAENVNQNEPESIENRAETAEDKYSAIGIGIWARENVKGYGELGEPSKRIVRDTIRQARALGKSDADIKVIASVSARSGLNIIYDGNLAQGDGSISGNTIYLNPENSLTRSIEVLLGHEMFHKLFLTGGKRAMKLYNNARKLIGDEKSEDVRKRYEDHYTQAKEIERMRSEDKTPGLKKTLSAEEKVIVEEEVAAHGAEAVFKSADAWEYILSEEPSFKEKVLGFFGKSARDYSSIKELSAQSRKFLREYRKMFKELEARNQGNNALSRALETSEGKQKAVTSMNDENMQVTRKFALNDIEKSDNSWYNDNSGIAYTKEQYNSFGWAVDVGVLSGVQVDDLFSKIQNKRSLLAFPESAKGEAIIEVNKKPHTTLDVNNTFVFVKGTKDNFSITRVIEFAVETETEMEIIKEALYERGTWSDSYLPYYEREGFAKEHRRENSQSFEQYKQTVRRRSGGQESRGAHGNNRKGKYRSGYSLSVGEDGEIIERFALPETDKIEVSRGERQKQRANYNSDKVYAKKDVVAALNSIERFKYLPDDVRSKMINDVWCGLNSRYYHEDRVKYNTVQSENILNAIKKEAYTEEQYSKYRKLQKERRIAKAKENAAKLEQIDKELAVLAEERGHLLDGYDEEQLKGVQDGIKAKLDALLETGKPSKKARMEEEFNSTDAGKWKSSYKDLEKRSKQEGRLANLAERMRDLKIGRFKNATQPDTDIFRGSIEKLTAINWRGNLNNSGTRRILEELRGWYTSKSVKEGIFDFVDEENHGYYCEDIADKLEALTSVPSDQTIATSELEAIADVMAFLKNFVENYGKVKYRGRVVDALPLAKTFVEKTDAIATVKNRGRLQVARRVVQGYADTFGDPASVMRARDMYDPEGFYTSMYDNVREGAVADAIEQMEIFSELDEFCEKNKKYVRQAEKEYIEYKGHNLSKLQLIDLYLSLGRSDGHWALAVHGFAFENKEGQLERVTGLFADLEPPPNPTKKELDVWLRTLAERAKEERSRISKAHFSALDKEYIEIVKNVYGRAKELKVNRDMEKYGYTNAKEGFYYPLRRLFVNQKNIDVDMKSELDRASNASFNKHTKRLAKQPLIIESVDSRMRRHATAVCHYAHLSAPIETFDVLFNLDTGENPNNPISVRALSETVTKEGKIAVWPGARAYFQKLISDAQGVSIRSDGFTRLLGNIRGNYARFQLGANPKVWVTQLSSFFASSSILDADSIARGMVASADDVDTYCLLAKLRNYDNTAAMAQGVLDSKATRAVKSLGKVGDATMVPIGKVDRFVVRRLFGACQVQVEKNHRKMNSFDLREKVDFYSSDEERSILRDSKNSIARSYEDILNFAFSDTKNVSDGRIFIGKLKSSSADRVENLTGTSVFEKSIVLTTGEMRHIKKNHGNSQAESLRGQEAITKDNFHLILDAIFDPDKVESEIDASGVVKLVFYKDTDGTATAVTVVSEKKKALTLKSGWIIKKGQHISPPSDVQAPNQTPNSELSMNAILGNSIAEDRENVKRNGKNDYSIGTEANKIEAGKLLTKIILETQQNSIATERSAAMRHDNEILRTATMFTADSMKVLGRVIDSVGEYTVLKAKLKNKSLDSEVRKTLDGRLKKAGRNARKSLAALGLSAAFMACVGQLFRWLYNKDQDEDESVAETMILDTVGNLFGGLPLLKDLYGFFVDGYELDNYAYGAVNDLLSSTVEFVNSIGTMFSDEKTPQDFAHAIRSFSYSLGQMVGVPTRNVYNVLYGVTKRVSPSTGYVIDNAFYKKNYRDDLYEAIESGDDKLTVQIMSLLLGERIDEDVDESVFNELIILAKSGQKVLPRSIPDSITVDKVEYDISAEQQEAIKIVYATSEEGLMLLVENSLYSSLSNEEKAYAVDFVYDLYYEKAIAEVLGINREEKKLLLLGAIGADKLVMFYLATKDLESDKDKNGKTVEGSKRAKVVAAINKLNLTTAEKLLLICAKGYSIKDGDIRGIKAESAKKILLRYILSLKDVSKDRKAELAEMCGFEVKNGRIMQNNAK